MGQGLSVASQLVHRSNIGIEKKNWRWAVTEREKLKFADDIVFLAEIKKLVVRNIGK